MIAIPWWFAVVFLGALYWPFTLALAVLCLAGAYAARGVLRGVLVVAAIVLAAELAMAALWSWQDAARDRAAAATAARSYLVLYRPVSAHPPVRTRGPALSSE